MTDRNYERCKTCQRWGYSDTHTCPPIWEARIYETKYENSWIEVHANEPEEAAAQFAEQYDQNGDYDIVRRGSEEVQVRKLGEEAIVLVSVEAESVPHYSGHVRS